MCTRAHSHIHIDRKYEIHKHMQSLHALIISLFLLPCFLCVYVSISVHMAHIEIRRVFQIELLLLWADANFYKQYNVENRIEIGLKIKELYQIKHFRGGHIGIFQSDITSSIIDQLQNFLHFLDQKTVQNRFQE